MEIVWTQRDGISIGAQTVDCMAHTGSSRHSWTALDAGVPGTKPQRRPRLQVQFYKPRTARSQRTST